MSTKFTKMAYDKADDMLFGHAKKPLSYGLGIKVGAGRVIPELTAGRSAEQNNWKQNEETKTGLEATHLSLCHLDPFAGVRGCQARTRDALPLAHS